MRASSLGYPIQWLNIGSLSIIERIIRDISICQAGTLGSGLCNGHPRHFLTSPSKNTHWDKDCSPVTLMGTQGWASVYIRRKHTALGTWRPYSFIPSWYHDYLMTFTYTSHQLLLSQGKVFLLPSLGQMVSYRLAFLLCTCRNSHQTFLRDQLATVWRQAQVWIGLPLFPQLLNSPWHITGCQ